MGCHPAVRAVLSDILTVTNYYAVQHGQKISPGKAWGPVENQNSSRLKSKLLIKFSLDNDENGR